MTQYTQIADRIRAIIADEWQQQGHDMTEKFMQSIEYEIETNDKGAVITFYDGTERGYGAILNKGVSAANIPYSPGSGAKSSDYISGLQKFAMHPKRMGITDEREALGVAFAIARKHKREGMPLPSTDRFSKTGKRIDFAADALKRPEIEKILQQEVGRIVKEEVIEMLQEV